jgi:serine/threonine protein kinase
LVNMVGACTSELKSGQIWLLLEHCSHGDMKNFLLRNRDIISQGLHYHRVPHETLNIRLFLKWSHSISKGMEYLASKNIMHGDLAARNILITNFNDEERYLAKVCDFGLSKAFYEKTSYVKQDRKNLPWKWMDVYFYETGLFRMSSDVWSFGVVLWEILSMGQNPYAGEDTDETIKKIKEGYRLPVPDEVKEVNWLAKCYNEVTDLCWQLDPKKRCNFTDLVKIFETHLSTDEKENYRKMEQNIIKNVAKQDVSKEAISFNNLKDNASAMPMNDIEVVYNNPTDEVIVDLEYVDPVVETTL